jgi:hypothetical protein
MFVQRLKYYIPWKLSSSSTIFCGLSYGYETPNPEKQNKGEIESPHRFDKTLNAVIKGIEWEVNPKTRIRVKKLFNFSSGIEQFTYGSNILYL